MIVSIKFANRWSAPMRFDASKPAFVAIRDGVTDAPSTPSTV
jgi:hypothetical protein